jgi:hypothetical protein
MIAEYRPAGASSDSGGPPTYTGWWFDLFVQRITDGLSLGDFVADYFTSTNAGAVAYVGATSPRYGIFVVDTGGPARVVVGPIARGYETTGPLSKRLTDEDARKLATRSDPWAASYTTPAPAATPIAVTADSTFPNGDGLVINAKSTRAIGAVTIELLDHHRVPFATLTQSVDASQTAFHFPSSATAGQNMVEAIRISANGLEHTWTRHAQDYALAIYLGGMTPPP